MSAIDTTFHFVRNPTAINGLATTYVSKRGSDVSGDGTAQNPYASIAKATSVATADNNIMLDDGEWNEARTMNSRRFHYWGNAFTSLLNNLLFDGEHFHYMHINAIQQDCFMYHCLLSWGNNPLNGLIGGMEYCIFISNYNIPLRVVTSINNCIIKCVSLDVTYSNKVVFNNCIFIIQSIPSNNKLSFIHCNFTNTQLPESTLSHIEGCINDSTTGQTFTDYFNHYDPNNWENCDFTAKLGSANIGAGTKGSTIGLNQGYTMYADNSADSVFKVSNGATLKNIDWDSNLNGYTLVQKERVCQGATSTTIVLDSSASAVDDYYNNLFIGIVAGDGYGELFLITDYDGATKTATIDGTWNTTPTTNSIYTISGTILSAVKDLGKAIKVKRNWTIADNFTALQDGQWAEFMTHVTTNGKQFPTSCYSYEYSIDGVNFIQGQTTDDLVSATNGDNKVTGNIYGDCSANYNEETAKNLIMRYIRVRVNIGFNIGQLGE